MVTGSRFSESETAAIRASFKIDDLEFEVGGDLASELAITDIDFRYGYSFFNYEEDGFRLGPMVAVSYTEFDARLKEISIGGIGIPVEWSFNEAVPIPTIGAHLEIPYKELVFVGRVGAFHIDLNDVEATGIRSELSVTWRPYENIGFYAGLYSIYADLTLNDLEIDDVELLGPAFGLEYRF